MANEEPVQNLEYFKGIRDAKEEADKRGILIFLKKPERRDTIQLSHPYDVEISNVTHDYVTFNKGKIHDKIPSIPCYISDLGITWVFGKTTAEAEAAETKAKADAEAEAKAKADATAAEATAKAEAAETRREAAAATEARRREKRLAKAEAAEAEAEVRGSRRSARSTRLAKGGGRRTRGKGSRRSTRRRQAGRR